MDVVWEQGPVNSRQGMNVLNKKGNFAYTTIMSTMRNLERKGVLEHNLNVRTYVYQATLSKKEAVGRLFKDIVNTFFRGSYHQLANALVSQEELDAEELQSIYETLETMKEKVMKKRVSKKKGASQ